jgi:geranylgeranyl diphosphate synthase type I
MSNNTLISLMLPAIEAELRQVVRLADEPKLDGFHQMLAYHMGWEGEGSGPVATGKRIRPLLVLLTNASASGDWKTALPAAAAVELVHNFSLIHDDIEDDSPLRRGRLTVWKKWGVPLAINAGDAMLTLAHISLLRLEETTDCAIAFRAEQILQQTCLDLTRGQHRDISYAGQHSMQLDDYWPMVTGKTGALLSACTVLGAMIAGANHETIKAYQEFGVNLGIAFQALDDLLGVWGDAALTGKSTDSDLVSGKKSLPVLFGLSQEGEFASRWREGPIQPQEVQQISLLLEAEGARDYTQETAACFTDKALQALDRAKPSGQGGEELTSLAAQLLQRQL